MEAGLGEGLKPEQITLSSGAYIQLPIRYDEWSSIGASFPVASAIIERLLPSRKLKPVLILPGLTIVTLSALEYHRVAGLEPYNEFVVAFPVQYEPPVNFPGLPLLFDPLRAPHRYRKLGQYIYRMPVTTQAAYEAGVEVWGFPKVVSEIVFEDTGPARRCCVRGGDQDIVTLEVKKPRPRPGTASWYAYTLKHGQLLRTQIRQQGDFVFANSMGGASWVLGRGPLADELRALKMSKTAVSCSYALQMCSLLCSPEEGLSL